MLGSLLLAAIAVCPAAAQPTVTIPRVDGDRIRVDAHLDEEAWQRALVVHEFHNFYPLDEGLADVPTEARLFYDDRALYVSFRCGGADGRVRAHVGVREDINRDDQVGVYLDTFDDDRRGFVFYVNAMGVQQDFRYGVDTGLNFEWDARYRSAGRLVEGGYVVEMVIPFRSLRFPRGDEQTFGLMLTRKLTSRGDKIVYPDVDRGPGMWEQAATAVGIRGVTPGQPLELIPSATFSSSWARDDDGQMVMPGPLGPDNLHGGLTMRFGPTPNTSLGVAINPDFSQVESDPDQLDVNTRYALYLDEKRPFFLEGIDAFDVPMEALYTRSIVSPLEGINLNGVERGWSVGLLHAVDQAPAASLAAEVDTPGFGGDDVEGRMAVNNVLRVRRDVGRNGAVGLFLADKELGSSLTAGPEAYNRVGGADAFVPIGEYVTVQGQALFSSTGQQGGPSIHGGAYQVAAELDDGHGRAWLFHQNVARDFRVETGFVSRVDRVDLEGGGEYRFDVDRGVLTDVFPWVAAGASMDHGGTFTDEWAIGAVRWRLARLNYLTFGGDQWHELYGDERFTGGGGWVKFFSSALDVFRWSVRAYAGSELYYDPDDPFQGPSWGVNGEVSLRLARRLGVEVDVNHHAMYQPEGDLQYDIQLVRVTALLAFTHDLWLRTVVQANSYDRDLDLEVLLAYVPHPGTAVYLGYSEADAWENGSLGAENRTLLCKVQVMFMP